MTCHYKGRSLGRSPLTDFFCLLRGCPRAVTHSIYKYADVITEGMSRGGRMGCGQTGKTVRMALAVQARAPEFNSPEAMGDNMPGGGAVHTWVLSAGEPGGSLGARWTASLASGWVPGSVGDPISKDKVER